ncbi:MAG: BspA family leucine-rich repeat surface protein, partial [Blautia sp.]|nr:BspA family leucine-rich repeat surface protein [Blautia sp.]
DDDDDDPGSGTIPTKKEDLYDFDPNFGKLTLHAGRYTNETIWWDGEKIGGRENVREVEAEPGVLIITATGLFQNLTNCYLINLSQADTSAVRSFYQMFAGCSALQELNISSFKTEGATRMDYMFQGCKSLSTLDLSSFNIESSLYGRQHMFSGCEKLSRLTLPEDFNVSADMDLNNGYGGRDGLGWVVEMGDKRVQSATGSVAVLEPAPKQTTTFTWKAKEDGHAYYPPVWTWDVKKTGRGSSMSVEAVATASFQCMYCADKKVMRADVKQETKERHHMVLNATAVFKDVSYMNRRIIYQEKYYMDDIRPGVMILEYGDFDKNTIDWNAEWLRTPVSIPEDGEEVEYIKGREGVRTIEASVEVVFTGDCTELFAGLPVLEKVSLGESSIAGGANLTRILADCPSLTVVDSLPLRGSPANISGMLAGNRALTQVNLTGFDTSKTEKWDRMFENCSTLESVDLKSLSATSSVSLSYLFAGCTSLRRVKGFPVDTGACIDFSYCFKGCKAIKELDLTGLVLSSAKYLTSMFSGCESLESIAGLERFSVKGVKSFDEMFKDCSSFTELDLSAWDTKGKYRISRMFENCHSLREIHLFDEMEYENFDEGYYSGIFFGCEKLCSIYFPKEVSVIPGTLGINLGDKDRPGWTFVGSDGRVYNGEYVYWVNQQVVGIYADFNPLVRGISWDIMPYLENRPHIIWKSIYNHEHAYTQLSWQWEEDYSSAKAVVTCDCGATINYPATVRITDTDYVKDVLLKAKVDGKWKSYKITELDFPFSFQNGVLTIKAGRTMVKPDEIKDWDALLAKYRKNPVNLTYDEKETVAKYISWWEEVEKEKVTAIYAEEGAKLSGNMDAYFSGLSNLTEVDISKADVSAVSSCIGLFSQNPSLKSVNLACESLKDVDASSLLSGCSSLQKVVLPVSFAPLRAHSLFAGCMRLSELDITSLTVHSFSDLRGAFTGCTSLKSLDMPANFAVMDFMELPNTASRWVLYGDNGKVISGQEETASIAAMKKPGRIVWKAGYVPTYAFEQDGKVLRMTWGNYSFDTIDWEGHKETIENVIIEKQVVFTGSCNGFFAGAKKLNSINLMNASFQGATDLSEFFRNCTSLTRADLRDLDLSGVQYLNQMFENCESLAFWDLAGVKLGSVFTMRGMFNGCKSMKEIDLSGFDGSLVENISQMFGNCESLQKVVLPDFSSGLLRNMSSVFDGCTALTQIDFNGLNTARVENMNASFAACASLKELDLAGFNFGSLLEMNAFVKKCTSLEKLSLPDIPKYASVKTVLAFAEAPMLKRLELPLGFAVTKEMELVNGAESQRGFCIEGGNGLVISGNGEFAEIPACERRLAYVWRLGYEMPFTFDAKTGTLTLKPGAFHKDSILWEEGMREKVKKIVCAGAVYLREDCSGFFANLTSLTELDLSTFDFSGVKKQENLLAGLSSLERITLARGFAVTEEMGLTNRRGELMGGFVDEQTHIYSSGNGQSAVIAG